MKASIGQAFKLLVLWAVFHHVSAAGTVEIYQTGYQEMTFVWTAPSSPTDGFDLYLTRPIINRPEYYLAGVSNKTRSFVLNSTVYGDWIGNNGNSDPTFGGFEDGVVYVIRVYEVNSGVQTELGSVGGTQGTHYGLADSPTSISICDVSDTSSPCDGGIQTPNRFRVTWVEPSDIGEGAGVRTTLSLAGYRVEVCFNSFCNASSPTRYYVDAVCSGTCASNFFYTLSNLESGQEYFVRAQAEVQLGSGAYLTSLYGSWSEITAGKIAIGIPSAPTLDVLSGIIGGAFLQLSWTKPDDTGDGPALSTEADVEIYKIEVSTSVTFATLVDGVVLVNATGEASQNVTLRLSGLALGSTYYVRVRGAHLAFGFRQYGNISNVETQTLVTIPDAPPSVNLSISGVLSLNLTWESPADL
eukprot:CAMPEP_0181293846 /NCGR_PEP_ID=MMETSP1101-20121128/3281_1 /TAXON_ID=46948 /ORGANISM="Rhodomonas abbreviata, Strain Caron Lab Isolate" /LENGTH=412 /DNA_ID=CAMNT_0023398457 /DNA_START=214 /DNA_END=1448 /DNA_ORIENTATION=-